MLPAQNSDYSSQSYWNKRYKTEEKYDWFPSVYKSCVDLIFDQLEEVYKRQTFQNRRHRGDSMVVLHLGCGNSELVHDLYQKYAKKYSSTWSRDTNCLNAEDDSTKESSSTAPYKLIQVAVDYSEVVIQGMSVKYPSRSAETSGETPLNTSFTIDDGQEKKSEYAASLPFDVFWRVADIRDLSAIRKEFPEEFDLIIDKGTMDALQVDSQSGEKEDHIMSMLREVSASLKARNGAYTQFIQVTWEIPLFRLHYTLNKENGYPYVWKSSVRHHLIGNSDMYRIYIYEANAFAE